MARTRTVAKYRWPRYDLDQSAQVADRLYERGGGVANDDALAAYLGYKSANNGAYLARVSSARLFGLLDGRASEMRPSARAHQILKPDYPATATRARLEAFLSVPLYAAFLEEYEGKPLPEKEGMLNALESRFFVPKDQVGEALAGLLDSARQAGMFLVADDRMIRPPLGAGPTPPLAPERETARRREQEGDHPPTDRGKLIDGLLDLLPSGDTWEEPLLADWLAMLKMALHVRYKVTSKKEE
jgi:hypothetical protein